MVILTVDDFEQMTILEKALMDAGIKYYTEVTDNNKLKTPYISVDGVPLDHNHAMKWIKEHGNERISI